MIIPCYHQQGACGLVVRGPGLVTGLGDPDPRRGQGTGRRSAHRRFRVGDGDVSAHALIPGTTVTRANPACTHRAFHQSLYTEDGDVSARAYMLGHYASPPYVRMEAQVPVTGAHSAARSQRACARRTGLEQAGGSEIWW